MFEIICSCNLHISCGMQRKREMMIDQNLVRPRLLLEASWVDIRCVYGDLLCFAVVPVEICYRGKKHNVKAVISSHLNLNH